MRRYRTMGRERLKVVLQDAEDPHPGHGEVQVNLRATSLNYRDLILAQRFADVVPLSDGAWSESASPRRSTACSRSRGGCGL